MIVVNEATAGEVKTAADSEEATEATAGEDADEDWLLFADAVWKDAVSVDDGVWLLFSFLGYYRKDITMINY